MQTGGDRWRRAIATSNLGAWAIFVAWTLIVLVLLTEPHLADTGRQRMRFSIFAAGHGIFFGILAFLMVNALMRYRLARVRWWTVVALSLYGICGELLQTTVPGRTPSIIDLGADTLGATIGANVWLILARWQSGSDLRGAFRVWPRRRHQPPPLGGLDPAALTPAERRWDTE